MFIQIAVGTGLMLTTIAVSGASLWLVETWLRRHHGWLIQEPHAPKLMVLLCGAAIWLLGVVTFGVWLWALCLYVLDLFPALEPAVYFALVSFTTLGSADIALPVGWRLLGGMAAANGFVTFGILIASLVEALRLVRVAQINRDSPAQK